MRITPRSLQEIAALKPLPKGVYEFLILSASASHSQAGREMIVLGAEVGNGHGRKVRINDYLSEGTPPGKVRNLCTIAGCLDAYEQEAELTPEMFVGLRGRCRIVVVHDRNGVYPDRNAIADFLAGPFAIAARGDAA